MSGQRADPSRSRILLVGTPAYTDPNLPDVPAIAGNIADLGAVFTDPDLGGFPAGNVITAPFAADVPEIGDLLSKVAAEAIDLLLFYYCGHGLVGKIDHGLYLSVRGTRRGLEGYSALPFAAVRATFLRSSAVRRVVILDSCFSGRAIGETLSDDAAEILEQVAVDGSYTLTSAPSTQPALARPGEEYTEFTGRLLGILRRGLPGPAQMITLGDAFINLRSQLRSAGLPDPQQRNTGTADRLGLVKNRAYQPPEIGDALSPEDAEGRATIREQGTGTTVAQSSGRAESGRKRTAGASESEPRGQHRVLPLLEHAERIAGQITDAGDRAFILAAIAGELTGERRAKVLDRAAEAAQASTETIRQARAVAAVAATSGEYARGIAAALQIAKNAESARPLPPFRREQADNARQTADAARQAIAVTLARADPGKAADVARLISSDWQRNHAHAAIARRLARVNAEAAIQAALEAGNETDRTLREIASSLARDNPARAEELLAGIHDTVERDGARLAIAVAVAASNLPWAMQVARAIDDDDRRWAAIGAAARAFAQESPRRVAETEQAVAEITDRSARAVALAGIGAGIVVRDRDRAAAFFTRAEELAMRFPLDGGADDDKKAFPKPKAARVSTLCAIAVVVAPTDPERSQRLTDEAEQSVARLGGDKNSYRNSEQYTSALFSIGAAVAAVSVERGRKLIEKGRAEREFRPYDPEPKEQLRATVHALTTSDPDRAESIAQRLLSGSDKTEALTEMAFDLAATDPDRAARIAGTIEGLVNQSAILIEIAVVRGGHTPSPIPWVDTELPRTLPQMPRMKY